jgi:hypothetical protein
MKSAALAIAAIGLAVAPEVSRLLTARVVVDSAFILALLFTYWSDT